MKMLRSLRKCGAFFDICIYTLYNVYLNFKKIMNSLLSLRGLLYMKYFAYFDRGPNCAHYT